MGKIILVAVTAAASTSEVHRKSLSHAIVERIYRGRGESANPCFDLSSFFLIFWGLLVLGSFEWMSTSTLWVGFSCHKNDYRGIRTTTLTSCDEYQMSTFSEREREKLFRLSWWCTRSPNRSRSSFFVVCCDGAHWRIWFFDFGNLLREY